MKIKKIPVPEIYKSSADFRFFIDWFATALEKIQYDTENLPDIYDPLRCPEELLWCLADTMGYKFDDRLPTSFNRLVLLYFMQMIYNRGSRNGMILAAQTNLAQFSILDEAEQDNIKYNRLESTSIPTNAVSVVSHVDEGYIDVVYFSTRIPKDACVEYVRPIGMYAFQRAGVVFDNITTKISIDAELTNATDYQKFFDEDNPKMNTISGPTQVGHYTRADYATLQKMNDDGSLDTTDTRHEVWNRNIEHDGRDNPAPRSQINPGYRALQSLQLSNNEHIMKSLIPPIFTLGEHPLTQVEMSMPDDYYKTEDKKAYNLRYDITTDEQYTRKGSDNEYDIYTIDKLRSPRPVDEDDEPVPTPMPAVNPVMAMVGDAISLNELNTKYMGEFEKTTAEDYRYMIANDEVTLLSYLGNKPRIKIPRTIEDLPVVAIDCTTFTYNENLYAIKIPSSVKLIR